MHKKGRHHALAPVAAVGLVLFCLWVIYPVFASAVNSLTNAAPGKEAAFVGADNYIRMLSDRSLSKTFGFTLIVTAAVTIVSNAAGVAFGMLLNGQGRNYKVMRTLVFVPQVLSGVVVAFIWRSILSSNGLLNSWGLDSGLLSAPINWLGTPRLATFSVIITLVWVNTAFCTVVYTASLQSVPAELLEAARVDGAGAIRRFRSVIWPMLAPGATIAVTLSLISVLKLYDVLAVLTGGGPAQSTNSLAYYLIQVAFGNGQQGYGGAIGMLLLALTMIIAGASTKLLRRREVDL